MTYYICETHGASTVGYLPQFFEDIPQKKKQILVKLVAKGEATFCMNIPLYEMLDQWLVLASKGTQI